MGIYHTGVIVYTFYAAVCCPGGSICVFAVSHFISKDFFPLFGDRRGDCDPVSQDFQRDSPPRGQLCIKNKDKLSDKKKQQI